MLERLSKFTPFVRKDQIHQGPTRTAAERNVRVPVGVSPHESPDPVRDGAIPARPARVQIATFSYDMEQHDAAHFQVANILHSPVVARPVGRQAPHVLRQNIDVAQHTAYGSMVAMNYHSSPYWEYPAYA